MTSRNKDIQEELRQLAPELAEWPGLDARPDVPEGYFEDLEKQVLARTVGKRRVIPMYTPWIAAAAAAVLLFIGWQFLRPANDPVRDFESQLAELDWLEVIAVLETDEIDLSAEEMLDAGLITADEIIESNGIYQQVVEETVEVKTAEEVRYLPDDLPELDEDAWLDLFEDDFGL